MSKQTNKNEDFIKNKTKNMTCKVQLQTSGDSGRQRIFELTECLNRVSH